MAGTTTSGEAFLDVARALAPRIRAAADEIDRQRALPPWLVAALVDAGFFRLLQPAAIGGGELPLPDYLPIIETLAAADASVGWSLSQAAVFSIVSAYMPPDAALAIFGRPGAVVANGAQPVGKANPVQGGYRISGRWSFSTGILHATWLCAFCTVYADDQPRRGPDGAAETRMCLLPRDQAEIIDTWQVAGMRGTGTLDFAVSDLFVPAERTVSTVTDPRRAHGTLYIIPQQLVWASGFSSAALGVARGALDDFRALAADKIPDSAREPIREQALAQAHVGLAEARLRAARALLHATVREVWGAVAASGAVTLEQRVMLRLATTHAIREAAACVDLVYTVAGTSAIYASSPLQRRFQDIHVITQHVQAREAHYETAGRFFLGLEPPMRWL